jgi:general nucleoside transport system permease protein
MDRLPRWADVALVPLISLLLAAFVSGAGDLAIGQDPVEAMKVMVDGALGSPYGWGYTLYYATNFMFTGLAVTVAFHAGLFNIGGEGQAQLGGLGRGAGLPCTCHGRTGRWRCWRDDGGRAVWRGLGGDSGLPAGARGSHIVITTIMFNFIAAALLNYLLVDVLRPQGRWTRPPPAFPKATPSCRRLHEIPGIIPCSRRPCLPMSHCSWRWPWRCGLGDPGARGWAIRSAPLANRKRPRVMPASAPSASRWWRC